MRPCGDRRISIVGRLYFTAVVISTVPNVVRVGLRREGTLIRYVCSCCASPQDSYLNNLKKENSASFAQVIRALVWRYVSLRHMQSEMNAVTEDHIQEIKSDISSLKFQLWDILKQNGMQIPSEHKRDKGGQRRTAVN